jgi:hypothetical protein
MEIGFISFRGRVNSVIPECPNNEVPGKRCYESDFRPIDWVILLQFFVIPDIKVFVVRHHYE